MIITSHRKFEIGKIYSYDDLQIPFEFKGELKYKYAFLVIKSVSEQEFLDYTKKEYPEYDIVSFTYFYQVSMD